MLEVGDPGESSHREECAESDVDVDGAVVEEPVHECAFWWHHAWVFLRFARLDLLIRQGWARITLLSSWLGAMGWWVEFLWLLEDNRSLRWRLSRGIADGAGRSQRNGYGASTPESTALWQKEAWDSGRHGWQLFLKRK